MGWRSEVTFKLESAYLIFFVGLTISTESDRWKGPLSQTKNCFFTGFLMLKKSSITILIWVEKGCFFFFLPAYDIFTYYTLCHPSDLFSHSNTGDMVELFSADHRLRCITQPEQHYTAPVSPLASLAVTTGRHGVAAEFSQAQPR